MVKVIDVKTKNSLKSL